MPGTTADPRHPPLTTLVALLCVVSGSLDAITFLRLGEAFASVMTGNIVFLGMAAGAADTRLATFCAVAIGGYAVGVMTGSRLAKRWTRPGDAAVWPAKVSRILMLQLGILAVMAAAWIPLQDHWGSAFELTLLGCAGLVMGVQGAAVRAIGVGVSTTYMTGALTTLLEAVATRREFTAVEKSAVGGLLSLAFGALLGSAANAVLPQGPLLVPIAALAVVLLLHHLHVRRRAATASVDSGEPVSRPS